MGNICCNWSDNFIYFPYDVPASPSIYTVHRGMVLLIVAYNLLVDKPKEKIIKSGESLRAAVTIIIFADLVMNLDNLLAIGAITDSNMLLIIAGIILSIPIILTSPTLYTD